MTLSVLETENFSAIVEIFKHPLTITLKNVINSIRFVRRIEIILCVADAITKIFQLIHSTTFFKFANCKEIKEQLFFILFTKNGDQQIVRHFFLGTYIGE